MKETLADYIKTRTIHDMLMSIHGMGMKFMVHERTNEEVHEEVGIYVQEIESRLGSDNSETFSKEELVALTNLVDVACDVIGPEDEPLLEVIIAKIDRMVGEE